MSDEEPDVLVETRDAVGVITLNRPPHNFMDTRFLEQIADAAESIQETTVGAIVIQAAGKNFCAGRDLNRPRVAGDEPEDLYRAALRMFAIKVPWVAAVTGAAIGAGLGLTLAADMRVASPTTRLEAPFARLGTRQGFGITLTLPEVVGGHAARRILLLAEPIYGSEAKELGLVDVLAPSTREVSDEAFRLAAHIAAYPRLGMSRIRESLNGDRMARLESVLASEAADQRALRTEK